jgi:hypothetical protein
MPDSNCKSISISGTRKPEESDCKETRRKGAFKMFRRKKREDTGPELSREEMEELVDENIQFAKRYANLGNVSGMEMSLEIVMQYAQKIGRSFDSREMGNIKLTGYERGAKLMQEKAAELQKEGKIREAQNAIKLASTYDNEAKMLKYSL